MGEEEKRKRGERTVSAGAMALKSPRLHGQAAAVQAAAASPSDSSESSEEATSCNSSSDSDGDSRRCPHMTLDSESVVIGVYDIKNSMELPTCHYPGCGITWKGDGEDKEGMMKCIECHYISCAGPMRADRDDPRKHALLHSAGSDHFIAQWYDLPNLGYCFRCERVMKLSDNQDQWSEDVLAEVDRKVKDEPGLVASNSEVDLPMVASSSNVDWASVTRNTLLRIGAGNDALSHASEYAIGNGYIIRRMPNHGGTCFMNASLQCLLALGKLRTMILRSDARLGELGLHLKQLFVETSIVNNARHMLDPKMIVVYMWLRYQDRFKFKEMGDSHEFLTSLRNALDNEVEELNRIHVMQGGDVFPTFGLSIFEGEKIHTVSCKSCSHNSVKPTDFRELILPLTPKDPTPPARSVAEFGNSQVPGLGLGDGAIEETPKPLQVGKSMYPCT
uniref:Uncharacterized protein n=1 Tax=Avena sativa TaxID=4498 RepID=A0ACD5ZVA6_AVESA